MKEYLLVLPKDIFEGDRLNLDVGIPMDYLDSITVEALCWSFDLRNPFDSDSLYETIAAMVEVEGEPDPKVDVWGIHEHVVNVVRNLGIYVPDNLTDDEIQHLEQIDYDNPDNIYVKVQRL